MRVAVAVIVVTDGVEIPEAAVDGEIAPPVVLVTCESDAFARPYIADPVGTAAEQRVEVGVLERIGVDGMLRQHRHKSDDERQFAVVSIGKIEAHRACIGRFGFGDLDVVSPEIRPTFIAQQFPGKNHIGRRHRFAVREAGGRIDAETDIRARRICRYAIGQQAVQRERFVVTASKEAFDDVAPHVGGWQSFHDEGVEAIEGAEHAVRQVPALRCLRIDVGRMAETRPPCRFPMHGDRMSTWLGMRPPQAKCRRCRQGAKHDKTARWTQAGPRKGSRRRRKWRANAIRSGFGGIYHKATQPGWAAFSAHSWLYCRREFGYQASRSRRNWPGQSRATGGKYWGVIRRGRK